MSNGTSIIDQVRGLSLDANVLEGAVGAFRGVPGSADTLPTAEVGQMVRALTSVSIPDGTRASEDRQGQLSQLLEGGIPGPEDALAPFEEQFDRVRGLVSGDALQGLTDIFGPFGDLLMSLPSNPSAVFSGATDLLVGVLDVVAKDTRLLGLKNYSGQLEQLTALVGGDAQGAVDFIQAQIEQVTGTTSGPVHRATEGPETALTGAVSDYAPDALAADLQTLLALLAPENGASLAERIDTLDVQNDPEVIGVATQLESAINLLTALGERSENGLGAALSRRADLSGTRLVESLEVAYTAISNLEVEDVLDLGLNLREVFESVEQRLDGVDPDSLLLPVRDALEQAKLQLGQVDITQVQDTVVSALTEARTLVQELGRLQIELTASLHTAISSVTDTIDQVDLAGLVTTVQDAISKVEPAINEARTLFDTVDGAIDSALEAVANALDSLSGVLVGEDTGVKKQIEDFLAGVVQTLENLNLQQVLVDLGEAFEIAFDGLKEVSITPLIEAVTAELEEMRGRLQEIDASDLNEILRAALRAALTVVVELSDRYDDEIKTQLLEEFDGIVVESIEQPFDFVRSKFEELVGEIEVRDPAFLVREAGLISLFEAMRVELDNFQPGIILREADSAYENLRTRLDGFSPEQYLGGIVELFQQLQSRVDDLSPSQLVDPLEDLLDQLKDEVRKIDVSAFADSLRSNIGAVTNMVDAISFEEAEAVLNEVYQPVLSGLQAANPEQLLEPIIDLKQQLVDAINQADLSALGPILQGIGGNYDQVKLDGVTARLTPAVDQALVAIRGADPTAMITRLRPHFTAIKTAAEGLPGTPAFEQRRAEILALANRLDPFPALSSSVQGFGSLLESFDSLRSDVVGLPAETGDLAAAARSAEETFGQLTPQVDPAAGIRDTITAMIDAAFENLALESIQDTYEALIETVERFAPEQLLGSVQALMDDVAELVREIGDPEALIIALEEIYGELLEALDAVSFRPLKADLDAAYAALTAKLGELDPAPIVGTITQRHNDLIAVADTIDIGETAERLDLIYEQQVLQKLDGLNPQTVLIEPLEAAFEDVIKLIRGLDIDAVSEAVRGRLEELRNELEEGLEQVGDALIQMLRAVPV